MEGDKLNRVTGTEKLRGNNRDTQRRRQKSANLEKEAGAERNNSECHRRDNRQAEQTQG